MKKEYMKPTMRVVRIQQQYIICTSPDGYGGRSVQMRSGEINNEEEVW